MCEGQGELHTALYRPIRREALTLLVGRPAVQFLWHLEGTCLRIANQMHDLADRLEVGSLVFGDTGPTARAECEVDIGADTLRVEKLIPVEENTHIESGIAIQLSATQELIVLPDAFCAADFLGIPMTSPASVRELYSCATQKSGPRVHFFPLKKWTELSI